MKRKNLNVEKHKNFIFNDKKTSEIYFKFSSLVSKYIKNKSFVVAVSGGPDSMALAFLANHFSYENNKKGHFVLIDHGIRKNSKKEAIKVKKILNTKQIKLIILRNKKKITRNVQKTAREVRYSLLSKFCIQKKAKILITAHHKEDQIETFLIRLSRGSGVEGLSSMSQSTKLFNKITLLRPLLEFEKNQLQYISNKIFKKTIKDPSNKDKKFLRTNIRDLTKILSQKGLNLDQIVRSIKNISSTKDAINHYVNLSLRKFVKVRKNETILNLQMFKKEPTEVKLKIINNIVKKRADSYYPPRSIKVLSLIKRFELESLKKCTLGGCIFEKRKNSLHVTKEF